VYATPTDDEATERSIAEAEAIQQRIWAAAMESSRRPAHANSKRNLVLLITVALSTAVIAGYSMSRRGHRSFLHVVLYATSIALTIYVVLDLEHPRRGLIRLDSTDRIIENLRNSIR
jgi:hypothetical protein